MVEREVSVADIGAPMPRSLSPTQAKNFLQCALKWWFGSVAGWRTPPTRHTLLGNVVHDALEQFYKAPPEERTRSRAEDCLKASWTEAKNDARNHAITNDEEEMAALDVDSANAIAGLWDLERPHDIDVTEDGLEAWVDARIGSAPVGGRIDRHTDDGVWRITDYKTGKVPASRYVEDALFGLWTYAAALAASHTERRLPDEVELLYVGRGVRIRRPVLRPYLLDHAKYLDNIWKNASAMHASNEVVARRGRLCDWCDFKPACPLVSGREIPTPGTAESDDLLRGLGLHRREREEVAVDVAELLDETPPGESVDDVVEWE